MDLLHVLILGCLLLGGCGPKHKAKDPPQANDRIETLRHAYFERLAATHTTFEGVEETGWPSLQDCDGTLWAGLAAAGGAKVHLRAALRGDGWYDRRPTGPCWTKEAGDVGSRSTFSNDMATGLLWGLWRQGDVDALELWAAVLEAKNWVMGEPFPEEASRLVLSGNGQRLLGRALYVLSRGRIDKSYRHVPAAYFPVSADYEKHLQALGIALQGEIEEAERKRSGDATRGGEPAPEHQPQVGLVDINDQMLTRLKELTAAHPGDALFWAVLGVYTGDFSPAVELLLDPTIHAPSYVRGDNVKAFALARWLFTAKLILNRYPKE